MSDHHRRWSAARRPGVERVQRFARRRLAELAHGAGFGALFLMCQSPLNALVIDDLRVLSRLGEPFLAEILVTPAAGERLTRECFTTQAGSGDLPGPGNLRLSLTRRLDNSLLTLRSARPMREPMTEFVLQVKCAGAPTVRRTFLVMVDPPALDEPALAAPGRVAAAPAAARSESSARRARGPAPRRTTLPGVIEPGSRYTVRSGDMLSTIAARVAGRPEWSVWPIAQAIYAANPGAFLLGNPNVIAEGATIYVPRLEEVDFSAIPEQPAKAAATPPRAGAATTPTEPVARAAPARASDDVAPGLPSAAATAATAAARRVARIAPDTFRAPPVMVTLPTMQLTPALAGESKMKLRLRREGVSVPPVASVPPSLPAATDAPAVPAPQSQPERPDTATLDDRAGLPVQARGAGWLGWLAWLLGLLVAFVLGATAAAFLVRRRLRRRFDHDLSEALRVREQRAPVTPTPAPPSQPEAGTPPGDRAAAVLSTPVVIPADDDDEQPGLDTIETIALSELDLELEPEQLSVADDSRSATAEMPVVDNGLDFELPVDTTGQTGQQEVDFELLERSYSETYENEFAPDRQPTAEMPLADQAADESADSEPREDNRYYHLEHRDPADEAPLPIELGEDEMGGEDGEDGSKVVSFPPKHRSG